MLLSELLPVCNINKLYITVEFPNDYYCLYAVDYTKYPAETDQDTERTKHLSSVALLPDEILTREVKFLTLSPEILNIYCYLPGNKEV